jgi:pimeloyl-ACP methyl ester carboxylesterase
MKTQGFATVNGTRLYYETEGTGHPLVLVHGFSLDTRMWDAQVDPFAERYRVIRYDVRGYGKSAVPGTDGYYHADDLKALLDHLGVERAHVLGLSLGAAIVTEFAVAYPQMTSALVAVDPVLWGYEWSAENDEAMGKIWGAGRTSGIEAARKLWLADPMFAPVLANRGAAEPLVRIVSDYSGWAWVNDDPGLLPDPPAAARLEEINVPTLAIVGELDVPDFHGVVDALGKRIKGARKVILPGVGHMSNMEDPRAFNEALLAFLASVDGR